MPSASTLTREHRAVLLLLRERDAMTRQDLADRLGWAKNTVAARLQELEAARWVRSVPSPQTHRGRPSVAYSLDPNAGVVFIASASQFHATFALARLDGEILALRTHPLTPDAPLAAVLASGAEARDEFLRSHDLDRDSVLHSVLGVPGAVDHRGNVTLIRLTTNDQEQDIRALAAETLGTPVVIENDTNLMALGERRLRYPSVTDFAYVKVGAGIGAGILTEGRLVRGSRGMAGELGHVPIQRGATERCFCGNTGCLSQFASLPAIMERAGEASSTREVFERVQAGDARATEAVRQAGRDLGEALVGLVSSIGPEVIVIGGVLATVGDHLVTGVRESIYARTLPALSNSLRIVGSDGFEKAALAGAVVRATESLFQNTPPA